MKPFRTLTATVVLAATALACNAPVGTGGMVQVPKDGAAICAEHCATMGLTLDAVVVMASNVGCVCRAAKSPAVGASNGSDHAGAAAGGMAALVAEEQQRQASQSTPRR